MTGPPKSESPAQCSQHYPATSTQTAGHGRDDDTARDVEQLRKRTDTARARLALIGGWCLSPLDRGGFCASRWGHSVDCEDLEALERFVERVAGRSC